MVFDKLTQLNPTKAPDPEGGWPLFCLKECAQELFLSTPLSIFFNKYLESSDCWKEALVTPVFKKGDRTRVNNYRPISLTSPICKIMESVIKANVTFKGKPCYTTTITWIYSRKILFNSTIVNWLIYYLNSQQSTIAVPPCQSTKITINKHQYNNKVTQGNKHKHCY